MKEKYTPKSSLGNSTERGPAITLQAARLDFVGAMVRSTPGMTIEDGLALLNQVY
jgi:hypothetical protein